MKDFKDRTEEFLKEYKGLTEKYQVDIATFPVFLPKEDGFFEITLQRTPVDLNKKTINDFIPKK